MWRTPGNEENCVANSTNVATYAKKFPFWDLVVRKWYGTHVNKPNCEVNRVAEIMMINFKPPVFWKDEN